MVKKDGAQYHQKQGYAFEAEWDSTLKLARNWKWNDMLHWKLTDTHSFDFYVWCWKCNSRIKNNMIVPKAIADYYVTFGKDMDGKGFDCFHECKSTQQSALQFTGSTEAVSAHQWKWGLMLEARGTPYHLIIKDRRIKKDPKIYIISISQWDDMALTCRRELGRMSIPLDMIAAEAVQPRRVSGRWDVRETFDKVYGDRLISMAA